MLRVRGTAAMPAPIANAFIVGGAKCGTTSMYRYLDAHPDAFMSAVKEPGFFAPDLPWKFAEPMVGDADDYAALFAGGAEHRVRGEASVVYLRSAEAAERIHAAVPDARIIVMLRHPLEVMQSLHGFVRYLGLQPEADFAAALDEGTHAGGRWLLDYRGVVDFAPQLARFQRRFASDQLLVVLHDDLRDDARATFDTVLRFLGLTTDVDVELTRENETLKARLPGLQPRLLAPSKALTTIAKAVIPAGARRRVRRRALNMNSAPAEREPLDPGLRAELMSELQPGIDALGKMTGRDLSAWK